MNRLRELYGVTKKLEEVVNQDITSKNREGVINQINGLVEEREALMDVAVPPFTEVEQETGRAVVGMNDHIQNQMEQLFAALKWEMKAIKKQKKSNKRYINPYESVQTVDGMFMDSKQ